MRALRCRNWFEIRYEPAKYAPLAAKQVSHRTAPHASQTKQTG
jgi:hypothetical protein